MSLNPANRCRQLPKVRKASGAASSTNIRCGVGTLQEGAVVVAGLVVVKFGRERRRAAVQLG